MAGKRTKKRARKEATAQQKARRTHRAATARHVLRLEADLTEDQLRRVLSIMATLGYIARKVSNLYRKRLDNLQQRNDYKRLRQDYHALKDKLSGMDEEHKDYAMLAEALSEIASELNDLIELEGIVPDAGKELAAYIASQHKDVHSVFALSVFEDVWKGVESILYGNGKHLSAGDFHHSIRTKQIERGITLDVKDGNLVFNHKDGIGKFGVKDFSGDLFLEEEVARIIAFLSDKQAEDKIIEHFVETGEISDTFRPCYVTLSAEKIRGKWRIWCLLTLEGIALPKKKRDGAPRHLKEISGRIGIDLGVSTYAACGANVCEMKNLAERSPRSTFKTEAKKRRLQRKMDRSRRANNPNNYDEKGCVKKGQENLEKLQDIRARS